MLNVANPLACVFKADYNRNRQCETILYARRDFECAMTFAAGNHLQVE